MDLPSKIIRFGKKEIYLPKFTVALVRTPHLSPYQAKFRVPLNFSKLDLRDYLFHAYNVRALSIRSFVQQQAVRDSTAAPRQFFRPEAQKFMTIEMDRPFVWPKDPESWDAWGKNEKRESEREAVSSMTNTKHDKHKEAEELRRQATRLIGKTGALKEWEKIRTSKIVEADEEGYKVRV